METLVSSKNQSWLLWFFRGLLVLAAFLLLGRLAELQIIKGSYFRNLAEGNHVRRVPITAPRGKILARGGEELVGNKEVQMAVNFEAQGGFEKVKADDSTPKEEVINEWIRNYDIGEKFAHVSGYLGEVNEDEVSKVDANCQDKGVRKLGSLIGRSGLESQYDCLLRGVDGEELFEVDSMGRKIRLLGKRPAVAGQDLKTTIDIGLQKVISSRMNNKKGAIVATDGKGEILAIYSSPSFDPNIFVDPEQKNSKQISSVLGDKDLPLFNRAIGGLYHPGSVFKIVTSSAALEEGAIDKDYIYDDQGFIKIDDFTYSNWYFTQYGGSEGSIGLTRAIARSTDTFFYKVGELTGVDNLVKWAEKFKLDKKTGVDLPGEAPGFVPTPEWKKAVKGERWFLGNTYHMAIGQGDLVLSPLQANIVTSVVANGGKLCTPYLKLGSFSSGENCTNLGIKNENLNLIKEGMVGACSDGGTGYPFFDFSPQVACKTGTAETGKEDQTHAWFTVFAPAENPEIVLTIIVENGGEGSKEAAPIAREILDYWFHNKTS
jgi:penicillin-binding protein 2